MLYKRFNSLCQEKNIQPSELAERSSISDNKIKKILNGNYIPTIHELIRLARTLGIRPGTLLDDQQQIGPVVKRGNDTPSSGYSALAPTKVGRQMEPFVLRLTAGEIPPGSSHEGEEFLYILEGKVSLSYGNDSFILDKGDSIYYDSIVEHCLTVSEGMKAEVLAVLYNPERITSE